MKILFSPKQLHTYVFYRIHSIKAAQCGNLLVIVLKCSIIVAKIKN